VFDAEARLVNGFAELDPYRDTRAEPLVSPLARDFDVRAGAGDEVFVYAPETVAAGASLWEGLAKSGLRVRVHVPSFDDRLRQRLADLDIVAEPEPVPFARIAERSRILVSHGTPRFVSEGFAAGLPHVVFHYDLEKLLTGHAVARLGLGGHVALPSLKPERFGADLARLHADAALAGRAQAAADGFRARRQQSFEEAIVEAVAALA
jgi:UDP:flavonoid glycosyltransferase YjiC (YdhE family)